MRRRRGRRAPNRPDYDIIVVGGGAAGLSLAYHLQQSPLRSCSLLLIDPHARAPAPPDTQAPAPPATQAANAPAPATSAAAPPPALPPSERTWCFWAARSSPFNAIVARSWSQLQLVDERGAMPLDLGAYRYQMIRGSDFARFVYGALSPQVDILPGSVERIDDGPVYASVVVSGQRLTGAWVFDSRFTPSACLPDPHRYRCLWQQFAGWEIEVVEAAFTPEVATFMDFRAPQHGAVRFFYVLPLSAHRALVEAVAISTRPLAHDGGVQAVRTYVGTTLGIRDYRILRGEGGVSLLTDQPFRRQVGRHVMAIGLPAGRLKPSTGYAFERIQRDSAAIVHALRTTGHPFAVPLSPRRYRYFDAVMLRIMAEHPDWIKPLFTALCTRQPLARLWRFLDEDASLWDNLHMLPAVPPRLLAQSMGTVGALRRV